MYSIIAVSVFTIFFILCFIRLSWIKNKDGENVYTVLLIRVPYNWHFVAYFTISIILIILFWR